MDVYSREAKGHRDEAFKYGGTPRPDVVGHRELQLQARHLDIFAGHRELQLQASHLDIFAGLGELQLQARHLDIFAGLRKLQGT